MTKEQFSKLMNERIALIQTQIQALDELGNKKGWTRPIVQASQELKIELRTLQWVLNQVR